MILLDIIADSWSDIDIDGLSYTLGQLRTVLLDIPQYWEKIVFEPRYREIGSEPRVEIGRMIGKANEIDANYHDINT